MSRQHTSQLAWILLACVIACAPAAAGDSAVPPPALTTKQESGETLLLPRTAQRESLPLGRSRDAAAAGLSEGGASAAGESLVFWVRTAFALVVVIALIFICRATASTLARRSGGLGAALGAGGKSPSGVLEVLGRYPVSRGHSLVLLRCDRRVLLLGQSAQGFRTLCDITDADDIASILIKTRDEEGASMSSRFEHLVRGLSRDPSVLNDETGPAEEPRRILREAASPPATPPTPSAPAADAIAALRARLAGSNGAQA